MLEAISRFLNSAECSYVVDMFFLRFAMQGNCIEIITETENCLPSSQLIIAIDIVLKMRNSIIQVPTYLAGWGRRVQYKVRSVNKALMIFVFKFPTFIRFAIYKVLPATVQSAPRHHINHFRGLHLSKLSFCLLQLLYRRMISKKSTHQTGVRQPRFLFFPIMNK